MPLAARMCALLERRASSLRLLARLLDEPLDRISHTAHWLAEKGHLRLAGQTAIDNLALGSETDSA
ncbi:MAG: hypothetical protein ACRCTU_04415, partial [Zoogloea sp.]|uniref:hypothetical protein n=1 Tax=Zoogloea sp. TaxID=49181 RepID=UPI003F30F22B